MVDPSQLFLSPSDSTPMYAQIIDQITAKVLSGDWPPGQPIPSIRQLAAGSKVSVITVKRAYLELEHAGVIVTRPGKGSFVADSLDVPLQLARQDFQAALHTLLAAAARLQLDPPAILHEVQRELLAREELGLLRTIEGQSK